MCFECVEFVCVFVDGVLYVFEFFFVGFEDVFDAVFDSDVHFVVLFFFVYEFSEVVVGGGFVVVELDVVVEEAVDVVEFVFFVFGGDDDFAFEGVVFVEHVSGEF